MHSKRGSVSIDVDCGRGRREGSLGTLTSGTETTGSTRIGEQVLLVFSLELLDEVVDEPNHSPPKWVSPAVALTLKANFLRRDRG